MILIRNGTCIDPTRQIEENLDILLSDGKIKDIGRPGSFDHAEVTERIDATGMWIVPGFIDLHVHLREPGEEWKETIKSGSEAAVLGGYTSILCMPNTKPVNDNEEVTRFILERAKHAGAARVLPIGAVSKDLHGKEMAPYQELRLAGCVAFSDDGEPVYNAGLMRRALEWCKILDVPIACHEEDKSLSCGGAMNESGLSNKLGLPGWPKVAEEVMIARDIELARFTKSKAHLCHVTTARGAELVRRAKNDGIAITAEVTPHHLMLTEDAVGQYDTNSKMSPPLREEEDRQALIEAIADGTIDCIASDHAPHHLDVKQVEFSRAAFGILGLQTTLPIILELVRDKRVSRSRAVSLCSSGPAKAFSLEGGTLTKGARADITIIDPAYSWEFRKDVVHSLSFNSPFFGRKMQGIAQTVIVEGRVVVRNQSLVSEKREERTA